MLHRLIMSCVFAGLALSAGTVRSDIVTFHFGGTLVNVDSPLSSAFSVGDSFTGSLSFEALSTINPDTFTTSSQLGIYRVPPAFTVNINGLVYSDLGGSGSGSVLVGDNIRGGLPSFDVFTGDGSGLSGPSVDGWAPRTDSSDTGTITWWLALEDWDSSIYTSDVLPNAPPPLSDLEFAQFQLYFFMSPFEYAYVNGDLNYLSLAPVPEPEIYAMLGVGLGLMGWVGRRRRLQAT